MDPLEFSDVKQGLFVLLARLMMSGGVYDYLGGGESIQTRDLIDSIPELQAFVNEIELVKIEKGE